MKDNSLKYLKMSKIKVTLEIDDKALELIDKAAKKEFSSRTNFLVRHSVKAAKIIEIDN